MLLLTALREGWRFAASRRVAVRGWVCGIVIGARSLLIMKTRSAKVVLVYNVMGKKRRAGKQSTLART
jgi:hypothetical protein